MTLDPGAGGERRHDGLDPVDELAVGSDVSHGRTGTTGGSRPGTTDPEPSRTPGLEPGGGVAPGDTPPIADTTSEGAPPTPAPRDRQTPSAIIIVAGAAILVGLLFIAWMVVRVAEL